MNNSHSTVLDRTPSDPKSTPNQGDVFDLAFDLGSKQNPSPKARGKNKTYPPRFEVFWALYPRHAEKAAAAVAYEKALLLVDEQTINAGARRYAEDPNRDPQFTKYPATWLNKGCWDDDPLPPRNGHRPKYDPAQATYEQAKRMEEVEREAIRGSQVGGAPRGSLPSGAA